MGIAALVLVATSNAPSASPSPVAKAASPSPFLSVPPGTLPPPLPDIYNSGVFLPAGVWVQDNHRLLQSSDFGQTWTAGAIPDSTLGGQPADAPGGWLDILDATHAWVVTQDDAGTDSTHNQLKVTVHRSTDGGRTWLDTPLPGNYPNTLEAIHFVDAEHGFVLIAPGSLFLHTSPLFATSDGGQSWAIAGTDGLLGSILTATDEQTIWAASPGDADPLERRIFAVSRDAGRTWTDVPLPGVAHATGQEAFAITPPAFVGSTGAIIVVRVGAPNADIDRSLDGGRTWTQVGSTSFRPLAMVSATTWLTPGERAGTLSRTTDAGETWETVVGQGLPPGTIGSLDFIDAKSGIAIVTTGPAGGPRLYLTSDAGATWQPADFGTVVNP
jgi:photosystem II stability/assembly factor-like uncharacterized protein